MTSSEKDSPSKNGRNGHSNGYSNGHSTSATNGVSTNDKATKPQKSGNSSGSVIGNYMKLRKASRRPLPSDLGDGRYRQVAVRPGLSQDIRSLSRADLKTLFEIISAKVKGEVHQDDKTMIMERTIQLVAGLPNHSRTQETLTNSFIDQLWESLDHPPMLYMGDEFRWRRPDGAFNNPMLPQLGAAGTKYARTCKPHITPLGALPDPEAVYEAVMARDGFKKNPNNVSSILWYWATIIIHDLFWTNLRDGDVNDASSYLDLSPLYGGTQEAQNSIRTFENGLLKPDCFADKRMLGNPPGVCILLIMFNRFHNHVATNLANINEGGRFTKPQTPRSSPENDEATTKAWKKYDEDLFQTARLVTSGLYINITLIDYVRNIIGLNRVDSAWTLDPRQEMGTSVGTKGGSESGVGNAVSAEFNLCYRWHSCISEMDDKWIQDFYTELLGDNYGDMNLQVLMGAMKKFEKSMPEDPAERTFSGFSRGKDGKFSDDDLVDALATAIEQPGGAFGARNVPRIMKPVELLGIIRGRKWHLAGLNEFRKHFGLKAYDTFEDINSDPEVAGQLRNLYQHPDYVELYPGLVAEEAKKPMDPGVGIAPTYTISRVVLSDAVSLVRGDRYYTTDYHPGNLTNWGYKEVDYNFDVNHGCVFYKLFIRAFPNHFAGNSIYAHYPMAIPSESHKIMTKLNRVHLFDFDRPTGKRPQVHVKTYGGAKAVLSDQSTFPVDWQSGLEHLMGTTGRFSRPRDLQLHSQQRRSMSEILYQGEWRNVVRNFYTETVEKLFSRKSYRIAGKPQVDIVRDIGNLAHTHFVARLFNIPLKTEDNPRGVFSEQELYQMLSLIYTCIYLDTDPVASFPMKKAAKEAAMELGRAIETNVKLTLSLGFKGVFTKAPKNDAVAACGTNMIKVLSKSGLSAHDIAWHHILPTAAALVPNQAQAFAQAVDFYLSPAAEVHLTELHRLASQQPSEQTDNLILGYGLEALRLSGSQTLHRTTTSIANITEDGDPVGATIYPGTRVTISSASSASDSLSFPNAETVDPSRSLDSYIHFAAGPHACLGKDVTYAALTEIMRVVFRKNGLKRVTGPQGMLKRVDGAEGSVSYMTEDWGKLTTFPTTMKVGFGGV